MHYRHNFDTGMVMSVVKRHFEQPDAEVGSVGWFVCSNTDPLLIWNARRTADLCQLVLVTMVRLALTLSGTRH
jgi:hypothetical protein